MRGSETSELEQVVRDDPGALDEHIKRIHRGLASEDPHERMDAGRTFRIVAEERPEHLEAHLETLVALLADRNGSVQLSGAFGIAALARTVPETVVWTVPELVALLEASEAPAIQLAAIRALTRMGERSPGTVAAADGVVAGLLRTATPPIKTAVVTVFAGAVVADPTAFPETVGAMEGALDDEYDEVRRCAAAALAAVVSVDPSVVSSVEGVLGRVEEMEARVTALPWHHDDTIERAARTLRSVDSDGRG